MMVFIPDTGSPITIFELTANFEPSFTRPRNYNILGMDFLIEAPADISTQIPKI